MDKDEEDTGIDDLWDGGSIASIDNPEKINDTTSVQLQAWDTLDDPYNSTHIETRPLNLSVSSTFSPNDSNNKSEYQQIISPKSDNIKTEKISKNILNKEYIAPKVPVVEAFVSPTTIHIDNPKGYEAPTPPIYPNIKKINENSSSNTYNDEEYDDNKKIQNIDSTTSNNNTAIIQKDEIALQVYDKQISFKEELKEYLDNKDSQPLSLINDQESINNTLNLSQEHLETQYIKCDINKNDVLSYLLKYSYQRSDFNTTKSKNFRSFVLSMEPSPVMKIILYIQSLYPIYIINTPTQYLQNNDGHIKITIYVPYYLTLNAQQALNTKVGIERKNLEAMYKQYKPVVFSHTVKYTVVADDLLNSVIRVDLNKHDNDLSNKHKYPYILKALGYHEYIYGNYQLQYFEYIYNCIRKGQNVIQSIEDRIPINIEQIDNIIVKDNITRTNYMDKSNLYIYNYFRQFIDKIYYHDRDTSTIDTYVPIKYTTWKDIDESIVETKNKHRMIIDEYLKSPLYKYVTKPDTDKIDIEYYIKELTRNGCMCKYRTYISNTVFHPMTGLFDEPKDVLYNLPFTKDLEMPGIDIVPIDEPGNIDYKISTNIATSKVTATNSSVDRNYNSAGDRNYNSAADRNYNSAADRNYNSAGDRNYNSAVNINKNENIEMPQQNNDDAPTNEQLLASFDSAVYDFVDSQDTSCKSNNTITENDSISTQSISKDINANNDNNLRRVQTLGSITQNAQRKNSQEKNTKIIINNKQIDLDSIKAPPPPPLPTPLIQPITTPTNTNILYNSTTKEYPTSTSLSTKITNTNIKPQARTLFRYSSIYSDAINDTQDNISTINDDISEDSTVRQSTTITTRNDINFSDIERKNINRVQILDDGYKIYLQQYMISPNRIPFLLHQCNTTVLKMIEPIHSKDIDINIKKQEIINIPKYIHTYTINYPFIINIYGIESIMDIQSTKQPLCDNIYIAIIFIHGQDIQPGGILCTSIKPKKNTVIWKEEQLQPLKTTTLHILPRATRILFLLVGQQKNIQLQDIIIASSIVSQYDEWDSLIQGILRQNLREYTRNELNTTTGTTSTTTVGTTGTTCTTNAITSSSTISSSAVSTIATGSLTSINNTNINISPQFNDLIYSPINTTILKNEFNDNIYNIQNLLPRNTLLFLSSSPSSNTNTMINTNTATLKVYFTEYLSDVVKPQPPIFQNNIISNINDILQKNTNSISPISKLATPQLLPSISQKNTRSRFRSFQSSSTTGTTTPTPTLSPATTTTTPTPTTINDNNNNSKNKISFIDKILHSDITNNNKKNINNNKNNLSLLNNNIINKDMQNRLNWIKTQPISYILTYDDKILIWSIREQQINDPTMLRLFLSSVNWFDISSRLEAYRQLEYWEYPKSATHIVQLLDPQYADYNVRSYATVCLTRLPILNLQQILLQLIQIIKFELYNINPLTILLIERSVMYPEIIGHHLYWLLQNEITCDIQHIERFTLLLESFLIYRPSICTKLLLQQELINKVTNLSQLIVNLSRSKMNSKELTKLYMDNIDKLNKEFFSNLPDDGVQLPLSPKIYIKNLISDKCKIMSSKMVPLWLVFKNLDNITNVPPVFIIFKVGDDLRQDMLTLQVQHLMDSIWLTENMDLRLSPYKVVATGNTIDDNRGCGIIEVVVRSCTTAGIQMTYGGGAGGAFKLEPLAQYLRTFNPTDDVYNQAVENFMYSCAGYCVATYVMGIGDRHNGNIMITQDGHLFHIDFGHFLGNFKQKFGVKRERSAFVFTPEMAYVIGGKNYRTSKLFIKFQQLCINAFLCLRKHATELEVIFTTSVVAGMKELSSLDSVNYLSQRLSPELSENEAIDMFKAELKRSLSATSRRIDNYFHLLKHSSKAAQ